MFYTVLLNPDYEGATNVKTFYVEGATVEDAVTAAIDDINAHEVEIGGKPLARDQFSIIAVFPGYQPNVWEG
ncbi:hypothetical protein OKX90_004343 [Salmonella enterica]|nr:hypothetical protein [Salmonella enterica]